MTSALPPSSLDRLAWMELAYARYQRGQLSEVTQAVDAAESAGGATEDSAHLRALVALQQGAFEEAERFFLRSSELATTAESTIRGLSNAGAAALEGARPRRARTLFQEALSLGAERGLPTDPGLVLNCARAADRTGAVDEALAGFRSVRTLGDVRLSRLADRFEAELRVREGLEGAEACWTRMVAAVPGGVEAVPAWLGLAQHADERGDRQGAIRALRNLLTCLPATGADALSVTARVALGGHLYATRDVTGAHEVLAEAARHASSVSLSAVQRARLDTNLGLVLLALGDLDAAQRHLEAATTAYSALAMPREQATQLRALVDLHRYRGDLAAAIAMQETLAQLEPGFADPLPEGGMLYSAVEDRSLSVSVGALRKAGPAAGTGPVLFLVPPAWGASGPLFPRGAVSVASFLEAHGISAVVLPLADVVDSHDDAARADSKTRMALQRAIEAYRPRAIGISVTFSYLYPQGQHLAAVSRELAGDTPIVMGGPHVTYLDRETLEETPAIDVVVRGEGEWTALELFATLANGGALDDVAGVTWRAPDGSIHRNKGRKLGDVRALPPVDFGLLPSTFAHRMDVSALTSRGCSFRCKFCHEFRYWGGVVRDFPVSRIIGEMERLAKVHNHLQGIDDSMLDMTTPLFMELVGELAKSNHVTPNFGLLTRLDTVTAAGARAMRDAGLRWVSMGAESGSQVVLDAMNKGLAVERTAESLRTVREAGLEAATFFIVGHPGDSLRESEVTLDFVDRLWREDLVSWIDVSTFSPYPGTPFYGMAHRYGVRILTRDWSKWRRTNRPVAELETYPAAAIYGAYLKMLAVQSKYRDAEGLLPPGPQATGQ